VPRILLVDDDEMNRDMLSRRLVRKGYEVIVAVDGAEAVHMSLSQAPDLVLMDSNLPILSGLDATRKIREGPCERHLPIISLTANAMAGEHERAIEAGCDDYVSKPVDFPLLADKIEKLLRQA
jgi:two-component system cell cycle response regulator DivK